MHEWRLDIETESPSYFWNSVVVYVRSHDRRLETLEHGPLWLKPLPSLSAIKKDVLFSTELLLGTVLNSVDAGHMPTEAEVAAFFDLESEGPKTLHLPTVVPIARCMMWPRSEHRLRVHIKTLIPEAEPYVAAMLAALGYPELAQMSAPPNTPQKPEGDAARDAWLQYYQDMRSAGQGYTLVDLAKDMHLSHGRAKHLRSLWLAERPEHRKDSTG